MEYTLNPFALPPLVVGFFIALLGAVVLIRERVSAVSTAFFAMTGCGALWLLSIAGVFLAPDPARAMTWARLEHLGVVFIPSAVYLFTLTITGSLRSLRLSALVAVLLSALFALTVLFTDDFLIGVKLFFWGYYPQYGPWSIPFLAFFFVLMAASFLVLRRSGEQATAWADQQRFRALWMGLSIAYLGSVDYLATFGWPVYPFGYLAVAGFLVIVGQAIWKYRLVEITPALAAQQVLKNMSDALLVIDREGLIRLTNPAACRLFEQPEAELLGRPVWSLHGPLFSKERLDVLLRTRSTHSETFPYKTLGGRELFLDLTASGIQNFFGEPVAVLCIVRDVTDLHRAASSTLRKTA